MGFTLQRYVPSAGTGGKIWWLAPLDGFGMLFGKIPLSQVIAMHETANPEMVRQLVADVPLRVAAPCQPLVRSLDDWQLRALLSTEPTYARLFEEHPGIEIVPLTGA